MKRIAIFFSALLILCSYCNSTFASEPRRVAILPVINSTYFDNREAQTAIVTQLNNHFKTPLSSVVEFYTLIPQQDILQAMPPVPTRKAKLSIDEQLLREIAVKTRADILIAVKLNEYRSAMSITTRTGTLLQQTDVELIYGIYLAEQEPHYYSKKLQRHYQGEASVASSPDYLLNELIDEIREVLEKQVPLTA